jgi:hypothetical protein
MKIRNHERCAHNPLKFGVITFFPNCHTLVILLQINLAFNDESETFYEFFYKTENISVFAWFSILDVGTIVGCAV